MAKKVLRWFFVVVGLTAVLLTGAVFSLDRYLRSHDEKLVRDYAYPAGLDIVFRELDLTAWSTFPRILLSVDSLVVRDTLRPADETALLAVANLSAEFSLTSLFGDTVSLRRLNLRGGNLYLDADSSGTFNAGSLLRRPNDPEPEHPDAPATPREISWDGVHVGLDGIHFTYRNPAKRKDVGVQIVALQAVATRSDSNTVEVTADLATHFERLGLNTDKGAYLTDAPVAGTLAATFGREQFTFHPARLAIAGQAFTVSAAIDPDPTALSRITVETNDATYDATQKLLPADLREKLDRFHVSGHFPAHVDIVTPLKRGGDPEVTIDFRLTGQDVRVKQYAFADVHATGRIVNRLEPWEGGIPGSKKNMRVTMDSARATYLGARVATPHATVAVFGRDARLRGPLRISGPAAAVSNYLENRNFFFDRGTFVLETEVDASLLSFEEVATTSDGTLTFQDLNVVYQPAAVRFPFQTVAVTKAGQDVSFDVESYPLGTGFSFALAGRLDNMTPLLVDKPGETLNTEVSLTSPRISWSDFLGFFGDDGYFADADTAAAPEPTTAEISRQTRVMKQTLAGIRNTFHPRISLRFDTVAYYDVLTVSDFTTGLNFADDTLVLRETSFNWAGSDLLLGAQLDLGHPGQTPFHLTVAADHLNLNALRPPLEYFGVAIPADIDSLPEDLSIAFDHVGRIADSLGIEPGYNTGRLVFNDGREHLFNGLLEYAPGPDGLRTGLHLAGDPQVVNKVFRSEDFFFGTGTFAIDVCATGNPADLGELLRTGELHLRVDSSRISYAPAGVFVPIESFDVQVREGRADYSMDLLTGRGGRAVAFRGDLDHITGFLFPERGEAFRVTTDASASALRWADLRDMVQLERDTTEEDTATFDLQSMLSATGGVFRSFRPDLSLRVDTFWAGTTTPLLGLHSGLRLRDSTELLLERSGFRLDGGDVEFDASYALDDKLHSPFAAHWRMDTLALEQVLRELRNLNVPIPEDVGMLSGKLTMSGNLTGQLDEATGALLMDSTHGRMTYRLDDAELADWAALERIGKKTRMRERLRHLRFAPLTGEVIVDSGRVEVPRMEVQSTGFQVFLEGEINPETGPDLLISLPLRNIGRGNMDAPPAPTGYARSGWKVYLVQEAGKDGETKTRFRLGRRRYFRDRGRLDEWRERRAAYREERRAARRARD